MRRCNFKQLLFYEIVIEEEISKVFCSLRSALDTIIQSCPQKEKMTSSWICHCQPIRRPISRRSASCSSNSVPTPSDSSFKSTRRSTVVSITLLGHVVGEPPLAIPEPPVPWKGCSESTTGEQLVGRAVQNPTLVSMSSLLLGLFRIQSWQAACC